MDRAEFDTLRICPRSTSDEEYERAGRNALKAEEVVLSAQTVWAGRIDSLRDLDSFAEALKRHFLEDGRPMYFIMAAEEKGADR